MAKKPEAAMRKRQQIASSNKTMFMWVAGVSVVIGFAAVIGWFLTEQIIFNAKILSEKQKTASILQKNNNNVAPLRENIRLLETNESLNALKARPDDKALQVVLDALPADGNSLALGSSLQERLIKGSDDIAIDSFSVLPLASELSADVASSTVTSTDPSTVVENSIPFKLVVKSRQIDSLKKLMKKFESSIRTIDVDQMTVERSNDSYSLTIQGHGYYEPPKMIDLKDKVVKP